MDMWTGLLDVLILLLAALVLGALCERLKQSAILGYLVAGTLLGPNALDWMPNHRAVSAIAELGVALLLFTIGLEFSWRRLRALGAIALGGGMLQVLVTGALGAAVCMQLGLDGSASVALGAMIALSSTACVLRLLVSRAEIDGVYGRKALGILLFQDIAVVPLVLIVTVLGRGGGAGQIGWHSMRSIGAVVIVWGVLYLLLKYFVPLLLSRDEITRNRELPILLAMVLAVGAAWAAYRLGLSPALGAFFAGMVLGESPFATAIRSDVAPLRTLFVTLFFSSIGMLADPAWAVEHWALLAAAVAAIVLGKAAVTCAVAWLFHSTFGHAVAIGICLAQVGEFSIVLADVARDGELIGSDLFRLIISATIVTLFLTPYLVAAAPRLATAASRVTARDRGRSLGRQEDSADPSADMIGQVVIVGFGPAGQRIAEGLMERYGSALVVMELTRKSAGVARAYGLRTYIGDATSLEALEHLHVGRARAVVVTVPDPAAARQIIAGVRSLSPETPVVARARYHQSRWALIAAGAEVVIDEEEEVGRHLALATLRVLRAGVDEGGDDVP